MNSSMVVRWTEHSVGSFQTAIFLTLIEFLCMAALLKSILSHLLLLLIDLFIQFEQALFFHTVIGNSCLCSGNVVSDVG